MSGEARRGGGERGRRGGGAAGPQGGGTAGVPRPENRGHTRPPALCGVLPGAAPGPHPRRSPWTTSAASNEALKQLNGQLWDFLLGRWALGGAVGALVRGSTISFKKVIAPAFLALWAS